MTTRVAAFLLAALSTTACVTDSGDTVDLDGLPAYDQDTGAGKGDDPNCSDVSYREFLQKFVANTAPAEDNPCKWGNDASYRIWAYVAGEQVKPMLAAYSAAQQKRFQGTGTREQAIAAGTLGEQAKAMLDRIAAIQPAHAGKVGFGAWRDFLYAPAIKAATQPVGLGQPLPDARDQWSNEITAFEEDWLAYIEAHQPQVTEAHSYTIWAEVAVPLYKGAIDTLSNTLAEQATVNNAFVERLGETHPAGAFDEDGAAYQSQVTTLVAADFTAITPQPARWETAGLLAPSGGGSLSYKTWAVQFANIAQVFNTSTRTDAQRKIFQLVIDARPCASGPAVDEVVQRLVTGLAAAGNGPDGTSLSNLSKPTACAATP